MKKILVVGICGAGKTTFARKLSEITKLPLIHLDQHFWNAGWVETPKDEWREKVEKLSNKDEWIIDGNYGGSFDIRFPRADTIIVFELDRFRAMYRALKRMLSSWGKTRGDMGQGCPERFDLSFLKFVWRFNKRNRPFREKAIKEYAVGKNIVRIRTSKEKESYLRAID